jgi:hypothetical protein
MVDQTYSIIWISIILHTIHLQICVGFGLLRVLNYGHVLKLFGPSSYQITSNTPYIFYKKKGAGQQLVMPVKDLWLASVQCIHLPGITSDLELASGWPT